MLWREKWNMFGRIQPTFDYHDTVLSQECTKWIENWCFMTLCSPRFLFRLFTPLWMVSMWISVNFRTNPFMHEVNDSSICLRIYSIDAIMQSKRQNFIQTTRPTLNKLARPPSWNDHSFSGTRQWLFFSWIE